MKGKHEHKHTHVHEHEPNMITPAHMITLMNRDRMILIILGTR